MKGSDDMNMRLRDRLWLWTSQHVGLLTFIVAVVITALIWIVGLTLSFSPNEIGAFLSILVIILSVFTLVIS